jgi:flagellar FliL protein
MADKKPEAGEEAPAAKKKPKLLLFIIIGVTVLILGGGAATFLLLKQSAPLDPEDEDEVATQAEKKRPNKDLDTPPVFVRLEPFTVKLQTEQQDAYVQATPELRVIDPPIGDRVKQYMPEIRHKVLLIMSGKKASELGTPQGVQQLSNEMRTEINLILDGPKVATKRKGKAAAEESPAEPGSQAAPDDSVQAVLFTSFIIQ